MVCRAHDQCWDEHRGPGEICEDAWPGGMLKYNWDWSNEIGNSWEEVTKVKDNYHLVDIGYCDYTGYRI